MPDSKRPNSDSDLLMYKIAVLACQGLKQHQIVERLDSTQPTVSRKMKQAQRRALIELRAPLWQGGKEVYREIDRMLHPVEDLLGSLRAQSKASSRLLEVQVLENPVDALGDGEERSRSEFARRVAAYLLDGRLPRRGTVGVAWGRTLEAVASGVEEHLKRPPEGWEEIAFVPICGGPPEVDKSPVLSAATVAARLETALTGRTDFVHSFTSVASFIPEGFSGKRAETIRDYNATFPGYEAVFGSARSGVEGLITELEGVLTSLGTNESGAPWLAAASRAASLDPKQLAAASAGNIGGLFVDRRDASASDRALVKRVNERWTGFSFDHLERCARAAVRDPERLGMVVIASHGAIQARTVRECVRRGYINRLLLDPKTASALGKML
jgi:DNA-binding transcriptional regulator LsrR (DeoR family)